MDFADLVLLDGNIQTMDPKNPKAQAIAVKGNKINFVGTNQEATKQIGEKTKVLKLEGKTVLPGFIDTHIHVADYGRLLTWLNLEAALSIGGIQAQLSQRVKHVGNGKWILGRALNPNGLAEKRLPTRVDLDAVAPDNPVVFYCNSGQVCVVNSRALEATKIKEQPNAGIEKTQTGELTGILRDDATNLVWSSIPEPTEQELYDASQLALEKIVQAGITSIHWIMLSETEIPIIERLVKSQTMPLRVFLIVPANLLDLALKSLKPLENERFRLGGAVIFSDGYLASRTAALIEPYSDSPKEHGKMLYTKAEMLSLAGKIQAKGLQLIIHAVGDRAVTEALDVFRESGRSLMSSRLEQAAVLNQELIRCIAELGAFVTFQPCVVASEFSVWSAESHLGKKRAGWLFPVKELLRCGVLVAAGSDCPMEPLNPLIGVEAAVDRAGDQKSTVSEALQMYTISAATASSEETKKGSIEQGKLADFVVLSNDPLSAAEGEMGYITALLIVVDGVVICSKK